MLFLRMKHVMTRSSVQKSWKVESKGYLLIRCYTFRIQRQQHQNRRTIIDFWYPTRDCTEDEQKKQHDMKSCRTEDDVFMLIGGLLQKSGLVYGKMKRPGSPFEGAPRDQLVSYLKPKQCAWQNLPTRWHESKQGSRCCRPQLQSLSMQHRLPQSQQARPHPTPHRRPIASKFEEAPRKMLKESGWIRSSWDLAGNWTYRKDFSGGVRPS